MLAWACDPCRSHAPGEAGKNASPQKTLVWKPFIPGDRMMMSGSGEGESSHRTPPSLPHTHPPPDPPPTRLPAPPSWLILPPPGRWMNYNSQKYSDPDLVDQIEMADFFDHGSRLPTKIRNKHIYDVNFLRQIQCK